MSVEKLPVFENFPPGKDQDRLVLWIKGMYRSISRKINFLLSLVNTGFVEITVDDQMPGANGNWRWRVDGADLVLQLRVAGTWTDYLTVDSSGNVVMAIAATYLEGPKFKITTIGGYAVKLTNKTGSNSVAGELVEAHQSTADAVKLSGASSAISIGVFLDSGITDGSESWIVRGGIAAVKYDAAGANVGDWIEASGTVGRVTSSGSEVPGANHFREIGHALQGAAANALGRIMMHHN